MFIKRGASRKRQINGEIEAVSEKKAGRNTGSARFCYKKIESAEMLTVRNISAAGQISLIILEAIQLNGDLYWKGRYAITLSATSE